MNRLFLGLCATAVSCAFALQFPATAIARSKETVLHSFGNGTDGAKPAAGLIDLKGTLYGTTESGGTDGDGTVFSVNPMTGAETVIYSFCRQPNCTDGANPVAGLIEVNGKLYGTTYRGGTGGFGTMFSVNPKTGVETVIYSFCQQQNCTDGAYPSAGLIDVNGTLYGTTEIGGTGSDGTVFSVDPTTGAETVVYSFTGGTDGLEPLAGVIAVRRTLYGTTSGGGIDSGGTVFALKGP